MMKWMYIFKNESLRFPEMVEFVPSHTLNPEPVKYYRENENTERYAEEGEIEEEDCSSGSSGEEEKFTTNKLKGDKKVKYKNVHCPPKSLDDINSIIENF